MRLQLRSSQPKNSSYFTLTSKTPKESKEPVSFQWREVIQAATSWAQASKMDLSRCSFQIRSSNKKIPFNQDPSTTLEALGIKSLTVIEIQTPPERLSQLLQQYLQESLEQKDSQEAESADEEKREQKTLRAQTIMEKVEFDELLKKEQLMAEDITLKHIQLVADLVLTPASSSKPIAALTSLLDKVKDHFFTVQEIAALKSLYAQFKQKQENAPQYVAVIANLEIIIAPSILHAEGDDEQSIRQILINYIQPGSAEKLRLALYAIKTQADSDIFLATSKDPQTLLHYAVKTKDINTVNLILETYKKVNEQHPRRRQKFVDQIDGAGHSCLFYAIEAGMLSIIKALIAVGSNPNSQLHAEPPLLIALRGALKEEKQLLAYASALAPVEIDSKKEKEDKIAISNNQEVDDETLYAIAARTYHFYQCALELLQVGAFHFSLLETPEAEDANIVEQNQNANFSLQLIGERAQKIKEMIDKINIIKQQLNCFGLPNNPLAVSEDSLPEETKDNDAKKIIPIASYSFFEYFGEYNRILLLENFEAFKQLIQSVARPNLNTIYLVPHDALQRADMQGYYFLQSGEQKEFEIKQKLSLLLQTARYPVETTNQKQIKAIKIEGGITLEGRLFSSDKESKREQKEEFMLDIASEYIREKRKQAGQDAKLAATVQRYWESVLKIFIRSPGTLRSHINRTDIERLPSLKRLCQNKLNGFIDEFSMAEVMGKVRKDKREAFAQVIKNLFMPDSPVAALERDVKKLGRYYDSVATLIESIKDYRVPNRRVVRKVTIGVGILAVLGLLMLVSIIAQQLAAPNTWNVQEIALILNILIPLETAVCMCSCGLACCCKSEIRYNIQFGYQYSRPANSLIQAHKTQLNLLISQIKGSYRKNDHLLLFAALERIETDLSRADITIWQLLDGLDFVKKYIKKCQENQTQQLFFCYFNSASISHYPIEILTLEAREWYISELGGDSQSEDIIITIKDQGEIESKGEGKQKAEKSKKNNSSADVSPHVNLSIYQPLRQPASVLSVENDLEAPLLPRTSGTYGGIQ